MLDIFLFFSTHTKWTASGTGGYTVFAEFDQICIGLESLTAPLVLGWGEKNKKERKKK